MRFDIDADADAAYLRKHRGDFWLWEKGETTEVDHE